MRLSFLNKNKRNESRPSYIKMVKRVDNSKFFSDAKKRKRQTALKTTTQAVSFNFDSNKLKLFFFLMVSLLSLAGIVVLLRSTDVFNIKEVLVLSDDIENYDEIKQIGELYKDKNALFLSSKDIEQKIKTAVPSVHTVFIDRTLYGVLRIEAVEDLPIYYLANNNGIYLINQDGRVMEVIEPVIKLEFSETEKLLVEDRLPFDSDQVREKYLLGFSEEERSKIIWKDVSEEAKKSALGDLKNEVNLKIQEFSVKLGEQLKDERFRDLIGSYVVNSLNLNVDDQVSLENLSFLSAVLDYFKSKNLIPAKSIWISDYTLEVSLENGPKVLLSVKREFSEQFLDINTLIYYGQFNGTKVVDVRSSNYSVVR